MSSSLVTVKLSRFDGSPWGFRLQGGKDFGAPLVIQKVAVGSLAEKAGLMAGDAVVRVNQTDLFNLRHKEAQDSIVRAGNNFELTVQRGGQTTWKPQVTPVGTMNKPNASVPLSNIQPVTKTSLAARKPEQAPIGSGHNVSAKPFATVPQVNGTEPIKAIVNKQYNTPVGIYSEETIAETLSAQAEVLAGGVLGVNFKKNERNYDAAKSEVLKMIHEIDKEPKEPEPAKTAFLGRTTLRFPTKSMTPTRAYSPGMQQMQKTQHYEQSQQYQHYQEQSQQYQEYSEQRIEQSQTYESQTQKYTEQSQSSQEYTQKQQEPQPEASQQLNRPATPSFRAVSPIPPYIPTPSEQGNAPSSEQAQGNVQESSSSMSAQNPGSEQPATQPEALNNPSDTEGDHGMPAPGSYPSEAPPVEVKCSGCEASIVGVFVRIKDKNLHVECFKCATCGTSLKNVGYYNINNKLYCDIHAKLVARHHPPAPNLEPVTVPPGGKAPAGAISAALAHSMGSQSGPGTPTPLATQPMSPQPGTMAPLPFHSPSASAPKPFSSVSAPAPPASVTRPTSGYYASTMKPSTQGYRAGAAPKGGSLAGTSAPRRGRGILNPQAGPGVRIPLCGMCGSQIRGPFITALGKTWCPDHFVCVQEGCRRPLQDIGFVEEQGQLYCEYCFEKFLAPTCNKCSNKIKGDCLNAIGQHFHPECFACAYCRKLFGNNPFFLEDGLPYCEADWNELFTTKCFACGFPIEAGDKWVEALNNNYHSQCFNCSMCKKNLEGQSFYAKSGRPFCKNHAR